MASSQFFGLNIASSALAAFQASVNTTANNISNVQTEGYSKQVANLQATGALRVNAKYGTTGTGVEAISITQLRDSYYDTKYWNNNSSLGLYQKKLYYMEQIEMYYTDDDTEQGFSTLLNNMFNDLNSVQDNAGDLNTRKQFISSAQSLATYFNSVSNSLSELQISVNNEIKSTLDNINSIAQKISLINKQINQIEIQGGYANELRDQRALLVDELSQIVPVTVAENPITNSNYPDMDLGINNYTVKINGQKLVDGYEYRTLTYTVRENRINQTDEDGLYDVCWSDTGVKFDPTSNSMSGSLKALFEIRDGNNSEYFHGDIGSEAGDVEDVVIDGKTVTQITVYDASITDIAKLSIAEEGIITVSNTEYTYSGFSINDDGSYTFTLEKQLNALERSRFSGAPMTIGKAVDAMGIPYYMSQMNEFLRNFAKEFNTIEQGTDTDPGVDADGNPMGAFFVANDNWGGEYDFSDDTVTSTADSYYKLTAGNFAVASASVNDPVKFAAVTKSEYTDGTDKYTLIESLERLQSDVVLYRGTGADDFLQCLLSDVSIDTQEAKLFTANYENIVSAIDNQRQSVSGVDEDEEALDLVKFQNAYNLASKMISVMSEMYDRLILETGV
ncbi:MAG: flagellar hook-associated protein FlgK [Roseburia sp.]